MEKKPKIAVIGLKGLPAFGGAATVGENIIEQLKGKYDFTVYATSSHTVKKGDLGGFRQIVIRALPFKRLNTLYYYILSALHAVLLGKYDLVHLHHKDAAFIVLILKLKYRVVLTTHGSFNVRPKWQKFKHYFESQEKYFVKYADVITCVSKNEQRLYDKLSEIKTIYIPNGVNGSCLKSTKKKMTEMEYVFFGAGRIIKTKGCEVLLKALNILNYKGKLLIAGDLDQTLDYKQKILTLSQNLDVDFLGLIKDKSRLLSLLGNAKLFVFPSSREAMSMMLLEGASMKVPIIASDIIQNKDIFSDEDVCFFQTDNPKDLADKILWAENNYGIMLDKARNAHEKLQRSYLWDKISVQYGNIFDNLIRRR